MGARLPREKESKIQRSIMVRLKCRFGVHLWRRNVGALREGERFIRFAAAGQSDLWGVMPEPDARHVEIEVKRPGNKPTPKQLEWLKTMHRLGCIAIWSDNVNDIESCFEAILHGGKVVWLDGPDYMIEIP